MKDATLKSRSLVFALLIVPLLIHPGSASQTPVDQGQHVLQEAAEAMGGLEALGAIEILTRKGTKQRSSLGQARLASERLYVQSTRPYTQIIDFTVPREVELTGSSGNIRVMDWVKGGYRRDSRVLRISQIRQLSEYRKEWDQDIARFLVEALGQESSIEGVSEAILNERPHQVVRVRYLDGVLYVGGRS